MQEGVYSHSAISSGCCSTAAIVSTAPFAASFSTILRPPSIVANKVGFETSSPGVGGASLASPTLTLLMSAATPATTLITDICTSSVLACSWSAMVFHKHKENSEPLTPWLSGVAAVRGASGPRVIVSLVSTFFTSPDTLELAASTTVVVGSSVTFSVC